MEKPKLSFYTNIPTPYQICFFDELAKLFDLKVIYYAATESNRQWNFSQQDEYEIKILKNNFIAHFFQKWIVDFHFSWLIFSVALKDKSEYVIIGGGYWTPNSFISLLISKIRSKKIAYFSEALFVAKNKSLYVLKWLFLRIVSTCCNAIFCTGKKAAESFVKFKVYTPKFIIPYNINPDKFQKFDDDRLAFLKKIYKPNNEVVILSSGSLIERKGMDILIEAFKKINLTNARLLIIGDGPYKEQLQKLVGTDKRIIFAGFQDPTQIPLFFRIADIFAFASRYDGWAVVINEAVAANLPIICSDQVGAAIELIRSQENGILCRSEDITEFKVAMECLLADTNKRDEIKNNMRELVPLISSKFYAKKVYEIFKYKIK